jgi:uncharacterized phage protein (TIGR01671 family)
MLVTRSARFANLSMREINFRAWDVLRKKMRPVSSIHFNHGAEPRVWMGEGTILDQSEGTILMQYTGLKDKNGKVVYEGDILVMEDSEWDRTGKNKSPRCVMEFTSAAQFAAGGWTSYDIGNWCEVIGNIYENPELIK